MKPLSLRAIFWYSLANLGFGAFYAFNNAALPLWLKHFTQNAVLLGLMAGTHSLEGAFIQPVVGALSDRMRTRWGRRRPFLLVFVPISAAFLLLTPAAGQLPAGLRLGAVIACIVLFTMAFNVALDPYQALMPDITPENQRGRVTGFWMFVGALGQISLLLLPVPLTAKFGLVAGLMLVTTLVTCAAIPEPRAAAALIPARRRRDDLKEAFQGLKTLRQARLYLAMFFLYGAGTNAVVPFLTLFIQKITRCTDHQAETMFLVLMLATAVGALPFGWLCDRIGPKRLLLLSLCFVAAASVNGLWVATLPQVGLILAVAGLGIAAQNASAYPLLTELVPEAEIGFYTGLQTTALSVAVPLSLALTGMLINHGGYRVIFAICSVCVIAALITLTFLRRQSAAAEIAARNREMGRAEGGLESVAAPTLA